MRRSPAAIATYYDRDRRLVETLFPSGWQIRNIYDKDRLTRVITPEGDIELNYLCETMGTLLAN